MFKDLFKEQNKDIGKCRECVHIKGSFIPSRYCPVIKKYIHIEQIGCMDFERDK